MSKLVNVLIFNTLICQYTCTLFSRMVLFDDIFDVFPVQMGINFGSSDAFMAKHFLHGTQVSATLYQMGGKRVAECVGTDGLGDTCDFRCLFNHHKNHFPSKTGTSAIKKDYM